MKRIAASATDLEQLASVWRVQISPAQVRDARRYVDLLLKWNERINLTGSRTADEVIRHHFPDAFAVSSRLAEGERVLDVGSGGGLPGLGLAILRPDCPLLLMEPTRKKVAFLRTVVQELSLAHVSILPSRLGSTAVTGASGEWMARVQPRTEETPPPPPSIDVAMSRATFPVLDWLTLGATCVRPGGRVIAFTAGRLEVAPPPPMTVRCQLPYTLLDGGRRWLVEVDCPT